MCGISGFINKNGKPADLAILQKMNRRLTHRGPDDEGYFIDGPAGLGHRRLSIIDLSGGHQPMPTSDGRYTIVFNGEIYNFQEIKKDLEKEGVRFETHSDTEVLLHLYVRKRQNGLKLLNGMFAFAIWDKTEKKLFAARDRMGKKPFYYWNTGQIFAFASECKSFLAHPDFSPNLDKTAARHFFQYEYVPTPYCIFEGIKKLPAGHCLTLDQAGLHIIPYWDIPFRKTEDIGEEEASSKIVQLLDDAVESRMISDVPLGVFLSGGIDSSSVVALMARHRPGKSIKTFSIGFDDKSYDETSYARRVAALFDTDHHHQTLTPSKLIEILPEVVNFLDEPFADYSIIPTYLLSKFTRQTITVALGGDGGDELFAGYPTFYADKLARIFSFFPKILQKITGAAISRLPVSLKDMSFDFMAKQFIYGAGFPPVRRNQVWLGSFHCDELGSLFAEKQAPEFDPLNLVDETMKNCPSTHPGDRMLYFYQKFYLGDDILAKTDRASMAASLEVRAPYLDVNLVEYAARLPYHLKLKGRTTKYILKKALEAALPSDILYRKKKGFGIPIALWLRNELKEKMLDQLNPQKIKREGIFNSEFVERLMQDHLSGRKNNRKQLFSLLMFEWWRERCLVF